ncbi:MAG: beta-N-acetylhexosaminidase [Prevotellaceae bacterium]|nr:beta-N-acetylhexosaminidase [Prevotellaceae bacterium]
MRRNLLLLTLALPLGNVWAQADYNVIPLPQSVALNEKGGSYHLTSGAVVSYPSSSEELKRSAEMLCGYLQESAGLSLTAEPDRRKDAAVTLSYPKGSPADGEAYTLTVSKKGVTIEGSGAGVFHGIQTLRKAIGASNKDTVQLPFVTISDEPRFPYRGAHIDCCRHFFSEDFLKQYIDILALHGCNKLHWHLTDDQGWRFEVKALPELAEQGSIRRETVIGANLGIYDGVEYGRGLYYTQEQCREVVEYARERYIDVIPEIELPGHMVAALHVYPSLGCRGEGYEVWTEWGVSKDILCAGNPKTLDFLKTILGELCDVFPSRLIHIGGDEAPRTRWKECPRCQEKMRELGLSDEAQLQTYLNGELEEFLAERGRTIIGWDEILEGGASEEATIMNWHGRELAVEAASKGRDVVMTPMEFCYFDYYQLRDRSRQPLGIGGYVPVSKVYTLEPVPEELSPEEARHILGAQCNLWAEYIAYPQQMEYMLLPRLSALSEVQWTQPELKDYDGFLRRLPRLIELYDRLGFKHCQSLE